MPTSLFKHVHPTRHSTCAFKQASLALSCHFLTLCILQPSRGKGVWLLKSPFRQDGQRLQIPTRCCAVSQDESIIDSELSRCGNVCQVFFHTCDEERDWASIRRQDNNNKQTWIESKAVITKTIAAPLTVALSPVPDCKSLCVSFSLSSHTFGDTGSENKPTWVLVQGNIWIRETGLKKFSHFGGSFQKRWEWRAGPGKREGRLNSLFLSNQKHLQPQKHILIAVDAKGMFSMFKAESIIVSPLSKPAVLHGFYLTYHCHIHFSKALYFRLPRTFSESVINIYNLAYPTILSLVFGFVYASSLLSFPFIN